MKKLKRWIKRITESEIESLSAGIESVLEAPRGETDYAVNRAIADSQGQKRKTRPGIKLAIGFAVAAAVVAVAVPVFIFTVFFGSIAPVVVVTSGEIDVNLGGKTHQPVLRESVKQGSLFRTGPGSSCTVRLNEKSYMSIWGGSTVAFMSFDRDSVRLELSDGVLLVKSTPSFRRLSFEVVAGSSISRFTGSALVEWNSGKPKVSALTGVVRISSGIEGGGDKEIILSEGSSINTDTNAGVIPLQEETTRLLDEAPAAFHLTEEVGDANLRVSFGRLYCVFFVDGTRIGRFGRDTGILLKPGTHTVRAEKPGFTGIEQEVILLPGESKRIELRLSREKRDASEWKARRIYRISPDDPEANPAVLGFASSDDSIVCVTQTSLVCISFNGTLIWKKEYGERKRLIFDSLPAVLNGRLYISTNSRLLIIDLDSGEEKLVPAPGIISNGNRITIRGSTLLLPYADGIYTYNEAAGEVSKTPLVKSISNPLTPLITDRGIYVNSFIEPRIVRFDLSGDSSRGEYYDGLGTFCLAPPVELDGSIMAANSAGGLFSFDYSLALEETRELFGSAGVCSLAREESGTLLCLATDGFLYRIKSTPFTAERIIKLDKSPDRSIYLFKGVSLFDGCVFIGRDNGEVLIVAGGSFESVPLAKGAISCGFASVDGILFAGTTDGEIIRLE